MGYAPPHAWEGGAERCVTLADLCAVHGTALKNAVANIAIVRIAGRMKKTTTTMMTACLKIRTMPENGLKTTVQE